MSSNFNLPSGPSGAPGQIAGLQQGIGDAQMSIAEIRALISEMRAQVGEFAQDVQAKREAIAAKREQLAALMTELGSAQEELADAQADKISLDNATEATDLDPGDTTSVDAELRELRAAKDAILAQISDVQTELCGLQGDLDGLLAKIEELTERIGDAEKKIDEKQQEIDRKRADIENLSRRERKRALRELDEMQRQVDQARQAAQSARDAAAIARRQIDELRRAAQETQRQAARATGSVPQPVTARDSGLGAGGPEASASQGPTSVLQNTIETLLIGELNEASLTVVRQQIELLPPDLRETYLARLPEEPAWEGQEYSRGIFGGANSELAGADSDGDGRVTESELQQRITELLDSGRTDEAARLVDKVDDGIESQALRTEIYDRVIAGAAFDEAASLPNDLRQEIYDTVAADLDTFLDRPVEEQLVFVDEVHDDMIRFGQDAVVALVEQQMQATRVLVGGIGEAWQQLAALMTHPDVDEATLESAVRNLSARAQALGEEEFRSLLSDAGAADFETRENFGEPLFNGDAEAVLSFLRETESGIGNEEHFSTYLNHWTEAFNQPELMESQRELQGIVNHPERVDPTQFPVIHNEMAALFGFAPGAEPHNALHEALQGVHDAEVRRDRFVRAAKTVGFVALAIGAAVVGRVGAASAAGSAAAATMSTLSTTLSVSGAISSTVLDLVSGTRAVRTANGLEEVGLLSDAERDAMVRGETAAMIFSVAMLGGGSQAVTAGSRRVLQAIGRHSTALIELGKSADDVVREVTHQLGQMNVADDVAREVLEHLNRRLVSRSAVEAFGVSLVEGAVQDAATSAASGRQE